MHPSLESVKKVEELLQRKDDGLPYNYPSLFPVDGFWARRASQRRLKVLKRIDEPLRALLWPDERVSFISVGVLYSFWESYFFGLPMYFLNRRALVLTNERLILIQVNSSNKPRELRAQIPLRAMARFGTTWLGNTTVKLKKGKSYTVAYLPRRDRARLAMLASQAMPKATKDSAAAAIENLCPHCFTAVPAHPDQCPACRGAFKSATKAGLLSLVFPGFGDVYIGHYGFAVFEILVASFIWLSVYVASTETSQEPLENAWIVVAFIFAFMHGADAISTWYVARKGHHPATND